jgi:putative restriction endonuclease
MDDTLPPIQDRNVKSRVEILEQFDLGPFTLQDKGMLLVSDQAHGTMGFQEAFLDHHGKPVRKPQRSEWLPKAVHLDWHKQQVFKGQAMQK